MRIITLNVNSLRSAARKGLFAWLAAQRADVVCFQEIKAELAQLHDLEFYPQGYYCYYFPATRKGYSGTALYARLRPTAVRYGLGQSHIDSEGRWLEADWPGYSVVSLYLPSGSSGPERQAVKFEVMAELEPHLKRLARQRRGVEPREYIICGDWNIAHREIDLKNWRGNRKNSGFLPAERAWLDNVFGRWGWVDVFRRLDPRPEQYTWWSNRGRAWEKNVGWRIDYQVATPGFAARATQAAIYKDQRFSDHAPLIVDYAD